MIFISSGVPAFVEAFDDLVAQHVQPYIDESTKLGDHIKKQVHTFFSSMILWLHWLTIIAGLSADVRWHSKQHPK